jgi:Flp pilus assembly pilin Flp
MIIDCRVSFFEDESGQGITEYGALLAFVGLLIAALFVGSSGSLALAVKSSFSAVTNNLNQIAANGS